MNRETRRHPKHYCLPYLEVCGQVVDTNNKVRPNTASKYNNKKKRHPHK